MTSMERVDAVLAGKQPDRLPFSFWYHFPHDQVAGDAAVKAHLDQLETYGMDFLKVMNDNPYPFDQPIRGHDDLTMITPLKGDEAGFGRQLELIAALRQKLAGRVYLITTIFNSWAVLRNLVQPVAEHLPPVLQGADAPGDWIRAACEHRPELVREALEDIGKSLASFARNCLAAGADGIFLSVRDDWVDPPGSASPRLYHEMVRPTDLEILTQAADARLNILHVCGKAIDFAGFARYPHIAVVNWADRAAGPSIASVRSWLQPAICAGVDNLGTLPAGTPQQVRHEVDDAIEQAAGRPIIIAPGCTFDPKRVPPENLQALAAAVREHAFT
jgi:uroporphyrinogen decarboxylase